MLGRSPADRLASSSLCMGQRYPEEFIQVSSLRHMRSCGTDLRTCSHLLRGRVPLPDDGIELTSSFNGRRSVPKVHALDFIRIRFSTCDARRLLAES